MVSRLHGSQAEVPMQEHKEVMIPGELEDFNRSPTDPDVERAENEGMQTARKSNPSNKKGQRQGSKRQSGVKKPSGSQPPNPGPKR
jgi:hypothetical protein